MFFASFVDFLDRVAGVSGKESTSELIRARSVVFWAFAMSLAGLALIAGLALSGDDHQSTIAALAAGITGLLASVVLLRWRHNARESGLVLSISISMGLALGPVIDQGIASPQLPILTATPVLYGFLVSTRSAIRHTLILLFYFPALVVLHAWRGSGATPANGDVLLVCFNFMVATAAAGVATVVFCRATWHVMDRLRRLSDQNAQLAAEAMAARQQFADFAHMASDWLWECDADGAITYSAGRFPVACEDGPGGVCGRNVMDLLRFREEDSDNVRHALSARRAWERVTARFEIAGRDALILQVGATPCFDAGGAFRGFRGVGHDVTMRLKAEEQIKRLANHDSLTGLLNRRAFAAEMADLAGHEKTALLLLLFDLDGFKPINDQYGHDVGDVLLQHVAARISAQVRRHDLVFRLGGDEFAVLVQGHSATLETGERLARAVLEAFATDFDLEAGPVRVGISVGIAQRDSSSPTPDDVFKHADLALYAAKSDGGLRHRVYTRDFAAKNERRRDMEVALAAAIEEERIEVQFQPQHRLSDGAVVGFEALARWNDPQMGRVSPGDFIPIAERAGLIRDLDRLVMQKAIRAARNWPACPLTGVVPRVCVNVSAVQVLDENFAYAVADMLKRTGLDPSRLEIELTESVLVQDKELATRVMDKLRRLGAVLAIDDFGTGYSSLGYLSRFPLDRLKIDRAFVMRIEEPNNLTITRSIAQLAFSLGLEVVAEGIESPAQMAKLRSLGVHIGQGFLFSKAVPQRRVAGYVRNNRPLEHEDIRLSAA